MSTDPFAKFESDRHAWINGGMQDVLAGAEITMTHDDLVNALGQEVYKKITDAGFVLNPREWRERVFKAAAKCNCGSYPASPDGD